MSPNYILFFLFAVAAYFIITDESVAAAFYFVTRIIKNKYLIFQWWLLNNPRNPIVKYLMWRRAYKLAKELQDELKSSAK